LGGQILAVEDEEFKQAENRRRLRQGKMSKESMQAKQAALTDEAYQGSRNIIINHGVIPGRPAPRARHLSAGEVDEAGAGTW